MPLRSVFEPSKNLVSGEKLELEMAVHPFSQLRSYIIGLLVILSGYYLVTGALHYFILDVVAIYLIYSLSLQSAGSLVRTGISAFLGLYGIFALTNFLTTINRQFRDSQEMMGAIASGDMSKIFSSISPALDPSTTISGALGFMDSLLRDVFIYVSPYVSMASSILMIGGVYIVASSYFYTRGQRIYFTDRRVIITKRFGGTSMFQATMDAVSDVSSNRGLGGRMFGYGSIHLTTTSGTGVRDRDEDKKPKPGRALQGVKLTVDGVKNPEEAVNTFAKIRIQFVDALHLKEIKEYVKKTAEALDRPQEEKIPLTVHGTSLPLAKRGAAPVDARCPWCGKSFTVDEQALFCPRCKTPYHASCLEVAIQREQSCPQCGAEMVIP